LDLPEEPPGTIEIAIPNQGGQTETKLGRKSSPDPGRSLATSPPFWGRKGALGLSLPADLGVFFNEGPKLIHLDLGELEIPKEHLADLFTMQGGHGQPPPDGIEFDFQEPGRWLEAPGLRPEDATP